LFKAGIAGQRVGPTSLGIALRACTILNKILLPSSSPLILNKLLLLLLLLLFSCC
jgi:hypothetical protein